MSFKIYTKTGDAGETGLYGGVRVSKSNPRINAYGTIDELNAFIGSAILNVSDEEIKKLLSWLQNELFALGADLATPYSGKKSEEKIKRVKEEASEKLEKEIDKFEENLPPLKNFVLPGGTNGSVALHICRTVCRRAEREVVELQQMEQINKNIVIFLNRLSDLFFVLSRYENHKNGTPDVEWIY